VAFSGQISVFPSCDSGNTIVFGRKNTPVDVPLDTLRERAAALKKQTRLDLLPTITRLQLAHPMPENRLSF
jgi:spermidine synthase